MTEAGNGDGRYRLHLAREAVYNWQGRRDAQEQDLEVLTGLMVAMDDNNKRVEVSLLWAEYARVTRQYTIALTAVQQAVTSATQAREPLLETKSYHMWGRILWKQGRFDEARRQLGNALERARAINNRQVEARSRYDIGITYYAQADYERAQTNLQEAQTIYQSLEYQPGEVTCRMTFGAIYNELGDYSLAQQQYQRALTLCQRIGWRFAETRFLGYLGNNYFDLGNYKAARQHHEQALQASQETGDREGEAISFDTLSLIWHHTGHNREGQISCQRALDIQREIKDRHGEGYTLTHLGSILHTLNDLQGAEEAFSRALQLRRELDEESLAVDDLAGLARVSLDQANPDQALVYVGEVLAWLETKGTEGIEFPVLAYLICYQVLWATASGDLEAMTYAQSVLQKGYALLQERARRIQNDLSQHQFLENVPFNREIIAAFSESRL